MIFKIRFPSFHIFLLLLEAGMISIILSYCMFYAWSNMFINKTFFFFTDFMIQSLFFKLLFPFHLFIMGVPDISKYFSLHLLLSLLVERCSHGDLRITECLVLWFRSVWFAFLFQTEKKSVILMHIIEFVPMYDYWLWPTCINLWNVIYEVAW